MTVYIPKLKVQIPYPFTALFIALDSIINVMRSYCDLYQRSKGKIIWQTSTYLQWSWCIWYMYIYIYIYCTVEAWEWSNNFITHFITEVITCPHWDKSFDKWCPWCKQWPISYQKHLIIDTSALSLEEVELANDKDSFNFTTSKHFSRIQFAEWRQRAMDIP